MLYLSCPVGPGGARVIVTVMHPSVHKGFSVVRHGALVSEVHNSDIKPWPTNDELAAFHHGELGAPSEHREQHEHSELGVPSEHREPDQHREHREPDQHHEPGELQPSDADEPPDDMPVVDESFDSVYSCSSVLSEDDEPQDPLDPLVGAQINKRFPGYGVYTGHVRCRGEDARYVVDWHDGSESAMSHKAVLQYVQL